MVRVDTANWYRLEGYIVPTDEYNYSTPVTNLNGYDIWYTNVEVQFQNPNVNDFIHGVNYKIRKFSEFGLNTIEDINSKFAETVEAMKQDMIMNEGALFYKEPLVITESCVICFNDALEKNLTRHIVIIKDDNADKHLVALTALYEGEEITVGETFNRDKLTVTGYHKDGYKVEFTPESYKIFNIDGTETDIVSKFGVNVFIVQVTYGENILTAEFAVTGLREIESIEAEYVGNPVALKKRPKKKDIIVTVKYTDGYSSTVTDWTYSKGNTVTNTNKGILEIYYLGFTCNVNVNYYSATPTQLKAFYNGPRVELNKEFSLEYLTVKIYYEDGKNSYWETLDSNYYTLDTQKITLERSNIITVTYTTNNGDVLTTNFIVEGFLPEKEISFITAEYVGPPVRLNKSFNPERVICKVHWNDNTVTTVTDFSVNKTYIDILGDNEIILSYRDKTCTFTVKGVEPETTTENSYSPTEIDLMYPEATRINHRRRGPMESEKNDNYNRFVYDNIVNLFYIYNYLEKSFKELYSDINSIYNTGTGTLNACSIINDKIDALKERR